jgi:hypothetical protein
MPQKNRTQLKDYFKTNDKPTKAQFIDLIDSMFTLLEDGGAAIKTMLHGLSPANRLTKSAVRGVDFALNRRGGGNLSDTAYISNSVVDVLKFDFWVHIGAASPRGTVTLQPGDWVVALSDGASTTDFGNTSLWWIPPTVLKDAVQTLTNKRIVPRVLPLTTLSASPTIDTDLYDAVDVTGLDTAITNMSTNFNGTPTSFQKFKFRIKDNGSAKGITSWGTKLITLNGTSLPLPTTTVASKVMILEFEYYPSRTAWVLINKFQEL